MFVIFVLHSGTDVSVFDMFLCTVYCTMSWVCHVTMRSMYLLIYTCSHMPK